MYIKTKPNLNEVDYYAVKNGICEYCGKHAARERKFTKTLNNTDKTVDGHIKDRVDIYRELKQESEEWKCLPVNHRKCEGKN